MWTGLGLGAMWLGSGTIIREVPNMLDAVEGNPMYAALLGSGEDMVRTFLGIFGLYIAAGAAAYGIAASLRVKGEEEAGRTELPWPRPCPAGAGSRPRSWSRRWGRWWSSSPAPSPCGSARRRPGTTRSPSGST